MNVGRLPIDALYLINVRAFVERRRFVEGQLARFGAVPECVHDWDADDITPDIDTARFAGSPLTRAQKSCVLKHLEVHRRIVARGHRAALVLEDDVELSERFGDGLATVAGERPQHPPRHVVHIGSGGNFFTPRSRVRPGRSLYPADKGRFTDAYLLDADTARVRLAALEAAPIVHPADNALDAIDRAHGITILWLEPPVLEQGSKTGRFTSSIEPAPPRPLQALKFAWERLRRKYLYQLWR